MVVHKEKYGLDHILLNFTFKVRTENCHVELVIGENCKRVLQFAQNCLIEIGLLEELISGRRNFLHLSQKLEV